MFLHLCMRGEGGVHGKGGVSGEVRWACRHTRRGMGDVRSVCVWEGGGSWQERRPLQQTCIVIGTHPTGMHSSFKHVLLMTLKIWF